MKIWNLFLATMLMLTVGFGAGYYAKSVAYSSAKKTEEQKGGQVKTVQNIKTPAPTISATPSPKGEQASAPGEAYIEKKNPEAGEYLLREYEGNIGVYRIYDGGNKMLVDIVDVGVEFLPESDKEMLKMGINVETKEEMLQLIEDYTS